MFCEQCGKEIPDNSKFCDGCGAPVRASGGPAPQYGQQNYSGQQPHSQPSYGQPSYGQQPHSQPYHGQSSYGRPAGGQKKNGKKKKDKNTGMTVLIVILSLVAVVLVAVMIVLALRTFGGSGKKEDREILQESDYRTESPEETEEETEEKPSEEKPSQTAPSASAPSTTAPSTSAPSQTAPSQTAPQSEDYILPNSNSAYLTEADLAGLTKEELRIARNELYARHGRKFKDAALNEYFLSKSWYHPTVEADDFNESVFNDYELANRKLIGDYEKKMGY